VTVTRYLLLGGSGFIGRHVAVMLARQGHDIVLADRVPPPCRFPPDAAANITWRRFEFASADWDDLVRDIDVIHLYAWTSIPATANANPKGDLAMNLGATLDLLEAMRRAGGKRLLFTSSGGTVYGRLEHFPVRENHPFAPITAYGAGKAAAEIYLGLYQAMHGLDCRIARVANPYGAGQDLSRGLGAVTTFLHKALTDQTIEIWGDGEVVRDYIHIADVSRALVMLSQADLPAGPTTFNIGTGEHVSLNGIIDEIERHLGHPVKVVRQAPRSFDLPINVLDVSRAAGVLGWRPRLAFSEGIRMCIADISAGTQLSTLF
jgi:UDP-glucose 4-epimerase